jgi:hypothetical protein
LLELIDREALGLGSPGFANALVGVRPLSVLSLRPKSAEQCIELQNSADRRLWPVARYAYQLREMDWDFKLQWPFEVFCSQALALCLPASKVCLRIAAVRSQMLNRHSLSYVSHWLFR